MAVLCHQDRLIDFTNAADWLRILDHRSCCMSQYQEIAFRIVAFVM